MPRSSRSCSTQVPLIHHFIFCVKVRERCAKVNAGRAVPDSAARGRQSNRRARTVVAEEPGGQQSRDPRLWRHSSAVLIETSHLCPCLQPKCLAQGYLCISMFLCVLSQLWTKITIFHWRPADSSSLERMYPFWPRFCFCFVLFCPSIHSDEFYFEPNRSSLFDRRS